MNLGGNLMVGKSMLLQCDAYENQAELEDALDELLTKFRNTYDNEQSKNGKYFAFWSDNESKYCEACDDDSQIYHGIMVLKSVVINLIN